MDSNSSKKLVQEVIRGYWIVFTILYQLRFASFIKDKRNPEQEYKIRNME